ncbi:MAG: four-carbon acid sugar kinase family protein [Terrabacter sp.]
MTRLSLAIVADDLSGAAECASHALLRVSRSTVALVPAPSPATIGPRGHVEPDPGGDPAAAVVVTVDTDSRRLSAEAAVRAVRAAAPLVASADVVVKKVDSLLRGHVGAEVAALAHELHRTPVVAVANPALQRVVRDGILRVAGTPLHETDLWALEPVAAPATVAEALQPLASVVVLQATLDRGVDAVAEALSAARAAGLVAVCDAATEADLEVVHSAATRIPGTLLVGSGALAAVAARTLSAGAEARHGARSDLDVVESALFVLGTRAPGLADQVDALHAARTAHVIRVRPDDLVTEPEGVRRLLAAAPPRGVVVVTLDPTAPADPSRARRLAEGLADAVAPVADAYDALFLSGGETARAVLDRLHVDVLDVRAELETGTVVSTRPGGRTVVTRPGSFGRPDSLVGVAEHLLGPHPAADSPSPDAAALTTAATRATTSATTSATTKENP